MGHVGSAGDDAAMESFFALLQRNVLDRRRWTSRDELRIARRRQTDVCRGGLAG
jgi:putative transposase